MLKIDTCIIVKNEENNIKQLIEQLLLFSDEIHITDTGSTDTTIDIINSFNNNKVFLHNYKWIMNFSEAKNYSLHCYDVKADYQFWCDGDDLLTTNLIQKLIKFKSDPDIINNQEDIYYIDYMYSKFISNPRSSFHLRTSLLKVSANLKWNDPIHEYISVAEELKLNTSYFNSDNDEYIEHQRTHSAGPRNMEIFMNMEKIGWKFDSRNYYYYANELNNNGYYKLAYYMGIECVFSDDLNMMDKINAAILIKNISTLRKFIPSNSNLIPKVCLEHLYKFPDKNYVRGDLIYELADIYYKDNDFETAEKLYLEAYNYELPNPIFGFLYNKNLTKVNSLLQLNMIEYYQKHDLNKCLEYNELILTIDPENVSATNNIKILKDQLNEQL